MGAAPPQSDSGGGPAPPRILKKNYSRLPLSQRDEREEEDESDIYFNENWQNKNFKSCDNNYIVFAIFFSAKVSIGLKV